MVMMVVAIIQFSLFIIMVIAVAENNKRRLTRVYLTEYGKNTIIDILNNYCDEKNNFYCHIAPADDETYKLQCSGDHLMNYCFQVWINDSGGGSRIDVIPGAMLIINNLELNAAYFYISKIDEIMKRLGS